MDDVALVHVAHNVDELVYEVAATVFAHGTDLIAEVKTDVDNMTFAMVQS